MDTHGHRFHGSADRLRSPERVARLEVDRVVGLSLEGIEARSVVDVGIGAGVFSEAFAARGLTISGIDVNPEMVAETRRVVPDGVFTEALAEHLPYADGSHDLVFMAHVLHEVSDATQALREARRVARLRVVVLEWPYAAETFGPPLEHRLDDATIQGHMRAAGFSQIERITLAHMEMYRLAR